MKFEIMNEAVKNGKPMWDSIVIGVSTGFAFMQSVIGTELLVWAEIFFYFCVGTFALGRTYWWFKNEGYEEGELP